MPSWIIHIGASYCLFKKKKDHDFRLIILGALLPDIFRFTYVLFLDIFNFKGELTITYFEPFATPFLNIFIALIVALFTLKPLRSFIILFLLAFFHIILDSFQKHVGFHNLLLYPFSFKNLCAEFFMIDHPLFIIPNFIFLPFLIYMLVKQKNSPMFTFNSKRLKFIILLFLFVLIFPIFTVELFYKNNFHYLQFYKDPSSWNNKKVEMCYCKIVSKNPLTVEEMGKEFIIVNADTKSQSGDFISIKGIYKDGEVNAEYIYDHIKFQKLIFSLIALGLIILIFLKSFYKRRFQ